MSLPQEQEEQDMQRRWTREIVSSGGKVSSPPRHPFAYLSFEEQEEQSRWAQKNYKPFSPIDGLWHPIAQFECVRINAKAGYPPDLKHPYKTKPPTKTTESSHGNNTQDGSGA